MTTTQKWVELSTEILLLYSSGKVELVEQLLKKHWIVFPELAAHIRDDDRIAFAAVSSNMQIGHAMPDRLRKDISFFIRAFNVVNAYLGFEPVSLTSPKDILFILQFARYCCHYHHLVSSAEVSEIFSSPNIEQEVAAANALKDLLYSIRNFSDIGSSNKDACIEFLREKAPGFSNFSYQYAYKWLSRNMTFDQVFG